jgi:hypothetical protein
MEEGHDILQCSVIGGVILHMPMPGTKDHSDVKKKNTKNKQDAKPVDVVLTFLLINGFGIHDDLN